MQNHDPRKELKYSAKYAQIIKKDTLFQIHIPKRTAFGELPTHLEIDVMLNHHQ
jgi:hypothetical protein